MFWGLFIALQFGTMGLLLSDSMGKPFAQGAAEHSLRIHLVLSGRAKEKKKKKKSKARLKSQKSRLLFFRGCKTSCLYSFGTDIEPPQFWLCCRERVSVAAQLHPLVPRVAEALLLHLSVLPVSSVLHPCAPSGDTCLHGFISAPSLSSPFPGEQHFLLVRAWGSGLPSKALSLLSVGAPGCCGCSSASLVRHRRRTFGGIPQHFGGGSPSGCCRGSQEACEQLESTTSQG